MAAPSYKQMWKRTHNEWWRANAKSSIGEYESGISSVPPGHQTEAVGCWVLPGRWSG